MIITPFAIIPSMIVIGGSSSRDLAKDTAALLGCSYVQAFSMRFPDGECYVRVDRESLDDDVVIIQNTYPDSGIIELLLLRDAVRNLGARSVTAVVPYFGYARQDRVFKPGEAESAKVMCGIIGGAFDRVLTMDLHKEDTLRHLYCDGADLKAAGAIAGYFEGRGIDMVISPDIGAVGRAEEVAGMLGVPSDHLEKTRLSAFEVRIAPSTASCEGKAVLIVDDMISTGSTIVAAKQALTEAGARSVSVACTHGLFIGDALERLRGSSLDVVVCCNTLENSASLISVAPVIADALRSI